MNLFIPIFDLECEVCGDVPCVGINDPDCEGIRSTRVCGPHFFRDRSMRDWTEWNSPKEGTE